MPRTVTEWVMVALLGAAIVCGATGWPWLVWLALALLLLVVMIGIASYEEVPASPDPSVAMPKIFGRRYNVIIKEGWVFVFPGIEDIVVEMVKPNDFPLSFDDVRCKLLTPDNEKVPGGSVTVKVSLIIGPDCDDPTRLRLFFNNGGRANVSQMVEGMLGAAVRQEGADMTWEEIAFAKEDLSVMLISMLTGLAPPPGADAAAVKEFLDKALVNGAADIKDLGIKVRRLNITEVEPEGKLKENADKAAQELLQRTAEKTDIGTAVQLAKELLTAMGVSEADFAKKTGKERQRLMKEALELVRIERGRASETIVRSSGNPFADAAAMLKTPPAAKPSDGDSNAG